jgi:hypothetical protein
MGGPPGTPDDPERLDPFGLESERADGSSTAGDPGSSSALRVAAAIGAALAALWLVTAIAGGGGGSDQATETAAEEPALIEPTAAPSPTPTVTPVPTPTVTPVPTPAAGTFLNERAARTIRRQLSSAAPNHSVIYVSADGVGELRLETGEAPPLRSEVTNLWSFAGGELLRSAAGPVYAVDDRDLGLVHIVATNRLAATMSPTMLGFADGESARNVEIVEVGDVPQWSAVPVPAGVALRALDTLGIVAVDTRGATSLATTDGFVALSDHEILAASDTAWIERRCAERADPCPVAVVDRATGAEHVIPDGIIGPDDTYHVAPDGSAVLITTSDGRGELYQLADGGVRWVNSSGMAAPTWAPDSSFIAWIDLDVEPVFKLLVPERQDWIVVDLDLLGAAAPVEPQLLVIQHPPDQPAD